MKILYLSNNEETMDLYKWLSNQEEKVVRADTPITVEMLEEIKPDWIVSYNYRYIIKKNVIQYMKGKIINLHVSLLPWNRGASPNVWSFFEDSPKGVTIHYVDEGLDTGDILAQREVLFDENVETFKTSYKQLHNVIQELFKEKWEKIRDGEVEPVKQDLSMGSYHTMKDLEALLSNITFSYDDNIAEVKKRFTEGWKGK